MQKCSSLCVGFINLTFRFSVGRATALILDVGMHNCYTSPVFDGYVLNKNVLKFPIAGQYVSRSLRQFIEEDRGVKIVPRHAFMKSGGIDEEIKV